MASCVCVSSTKDCCFGPWRPSIAGFLCAGPLWVCRPTASPGLQAYGPLRMEGYAWEKLSTYSGISFFVLCLFSAPWTGAGWSWAGQAPAEPWGWHRRCTRRGPMRPGGDGGSLRGTGSRLQGPGPPQELRGGGRMLAMPRMARMDTFRGQQGYRAGGGGGEEELRGAGRGSCARGACVRTKSNVCCGVHGPRQGPVGGSGQGPRRCQRGGRQGQGRCEPVCAGPHRAHL